ncbi:MAG: flagellar basal body L-ring protein FlgH, partial [Planctomycetes bacterium]|nr:flagellar basal body L-ring protein FlgH [Planctomycetota bacterium]
MKTRSHYLTFAAALVTASALSAQSLWNPNRPTASIFSDTTARNVGDILTIV